MSVPTVTPSSVVALPAMTLGSTRTPPLAIVLIAAAICTALTESDCPNAIRSLVCDVSSGPAGMMPARLAADADVGAGAEAEGAQVAAQGLPG